MSNFLKIAGTSSNSFSIGLKANKKTITVGATNLQIDAQLDMDTHKIINVTNPASAQDAMTLNYADTNYLNVSQKGDPNGLATLVGGKIPVSQLPNSVMEFQGAWNAFTNSPTLADGTGNAGDVYRVSVEGTQDLGSGSVKFYVGDFVIYSGTVWQRSPMADGVISIFGRTGIVTSANGDYTASQITNVPAGAIASTTVQAALNELDTEKMALIASPTLGHIVTTDATGQGVDSGTALSSLATTSQVNAKMNLVATPTLGHVITTDATGQGVDSGTALSTLTAKMNLIATPTLGHLVTTDASGQATDSGTAASSIMLLAATPTNGHVLTTNALGQAIDSGIVAANLVTSTDIATATKTIAIPIAQANVASTFALPNGAVIKNVSLVVTTPYTATGVISASVGAVSILDTSDNDAQTAAQYSNSDIISIATGAVVSVVVAGTSIVAGASTLHVDFVTSPLA